MLPHPQQPTRPCPHGVQDLDKRTDPFAPALRDAPSSAFVPEVYAYNPRARPRTLCGALLLALSTMAFSLGLYVLWLLSSTTAAHPAPADTARGYVPRTPDLGLPDWIGHSLAQYSSYWPVERYRAPPAGCAVDQVNIVRG